MSYNTLLYATDGAGVGTITINRPANFNGMTGEMGAELREVLAQAAEDAGVRVLVITGTGRSFCPGADLKYFGAAGPAADNPDAVARRDAVAVMLHEHPAVTIAAINGACAGPGLGLACACDLRFAARSAVFNTAFLDVGVAGDFALAWTLPRLIGAARARELSFFCEKFSAEEALRAGLVSHVWEDGAFGNEVAVFAQRLARKAPAALATMKADYLAAERLPLADFHDLEMERHLKLLQTPNTREAFRAWVEKREPNFTY